MNFFNSAYEGIPPWNIGRPQKEIIRLAADGEISGTVLDAGCGKGENELYLGSLGFGVWGVDAAPSAIKKAEEKAKESEISVNFLVCDALKLQLLQNKFNTVIDCGLFHVFSDDSALVLMPESCILNILQG
jgi:2-polyprenyl-3-methyl-5-hydroxy-6-metoxy-1,4-benzoquinol methylase